MNFVKGLMVGSLVSASVILMCTETDCINPKRMVKKGRKFIKNITNN